MSPDPRYSRPSQVNSFVSENVSGPLASMLIAQHEYILFGHARIKADPWAKRIIIPGQSANSDFRCRITSDRNDPALLSYSGIYQHESV
jgi:hypothetical protein